MLVRTGLASLRNGCVTCSLRGRQTKPLRISHHLSWTQLTATVSSPSNHIDTRSIVDITTNEIHCPYTVTSCFRARNGALIHCECTVLPPPVRVACRHTQPRAANRDLAVDLPHCEYRESWPHACSLLPCLVAPNYCPSYTGVLSSTRRFPSGIHIPALVAPITAAPPRIE